MTPIITNKKLAVNSRIRVCFSSCEANLFETWASSFQLSHLDQSHQMRNSPLLTYYFFQEDTEILIVFNCLKVRFRYILITLLTSSEEFFVTFLSLIRPIFNKRSHWTQTQKCLKLQKHLFIFISCYVSSACTRWDFLWKLGTLRANVPF